MLLLCVGAASARSNQDLLKANYLYRQLAFNEAIPYYEKVATDANDPEIYVQLGDCYRLTKRNTEAAAAYAKAVVMNGCPDMAKLHYGQVLMTLGKYSEASKWLKQYAATAPNEKRVANLITSCAWAPEMTGKIPSGVVVFQPFNTNGSDFGPALRKEQLVFASDTMVKGANVAKTDDWTGNPYYNILAVSCDPMGRCNSTITKIASDINTKFHDGPATFSGDGSTMYFTRTNISKQFLSRNSLPDQQGVVRLQIIVAKDYDEATGKFGKIEQFPFNSKDYSTAHPTVSPSGNTIVFASDMPGGQGGTDLYITTKQQGGNWSKPENLGGIINTEGDEMFPFLQDDNTLYFSSDGHVGLGGLDIYSATRSSAGTFSQPEHAGIPVNSLNDDMSAVVHPVSNGIYFASNRPAEKGGDNIFFLNRQRVYLGLKIIDGATKKPLVGAAVTLKSTNSESRYTADMSGGVFTRLAPQSQYNVAITKAGYTSRNMNISSFDMKDNDTLWQEVSMEPDFSITYSAVVLDEKTGAAIEDPIVVFSKIGRSQSDSLVLPPGNAYTRTLSPNTEYYVYAVKDNYYSNEKVISTMGIDQSVGHTTLQDTIYMKKLQVGEVYKIENIYYDYDKANIREDAKPSLNRLLDLLAQYPQMKIQVNSHTDCRGSDSYNMNLSKARANSVIKYLQQRGIAKNRLLYKGYGETMPKESCDNCDACSETQHQANRRTEFQIIAM